MQFAILGRLEVHNGAGDCTPAPGKRRALLVLLLLARGTPVPVDRLVDELWDGEPPPKARNAVQAHVSKLRKELGDAGRFVAGGPAGYTLELDEESFDLTRFERLVAGAGREEAEAAAELLREALALWRGRALCDVPGRFAEREAARLEELRLETLEARVDADLELGGHDGLVSELEGLVEEHPYRERLRAQLMLALYRSGRQADALAVYAEGRRLLAAELGLEPGRSLRELERRILGQAPELDPPVRLGIRSNLPVPPTAMLGRDRETAAASAMLRVPGVRLVTLTGAGGIGKTRIALEVAHVLEPEFGGATYFVRLGAIVDPKLVLPTMARTLGLSATAGDDAETLVGALPHHPLLLVLDNFEQLLDAAGDVAGLLAAAPQLNLLVTSRAQLHVSGEHELPVPPLDLGSSELLFVERARAAGASFELTSANAAAITEICRRLEGLPLAIELAAARSKLLPPPALLDRLERRLDVLAGGARDLPERQQTIRATIDWSYNLLSADEQALFAELGVFTGGASLDLVEPVCEGREVLPLLSSLLDKSLLRATGEEPRFAMLETVREYALERLEAMGEAERIRRRHAECFCLLAERAENELIGSDQESWFARLELEHDNFRAALAWTVAAGETALAARLAIALARFWNIHGYLAEYRRWYEALLAGAGDLAPALRAKVLNRAGGLALRQGRTHESIELAEESLVIFRELGDLAEMGRAMNNLASGAARLGDVRVAEERYRAAAAFYEEAGDLHGAAQATSNGACVAISRGDHELAFELSSDAVRTSRMIGNTHLVAVGLHNLALVDVARGRWREAEPVLKESLVAAAETGYKESIAFTFETLAVVHVSAGDPADGALLLGAASELEAELGMALDEPEAEMHVEAVAAARAALGPEFDELWRRGRGLGLERALALAFEISIHNSSH